MIKEYGLEPILLNSWQNFRYFVEKFGVSQGRLISRYPKRWKKLVYESLAGCRDLERKRIEEGLASINDKLMARSADWDDQLGWLANALDEHAKRPFHAIIARANPGNQSFVLEADDLSEATTPLWRVKRCAIIARTAKEIAESVGPLVQISRHIALVDPHFAPDKIQYRRPLESILEATVKSPKVHPTTIEFHVADKWAKGHFEAECRRYLPQVIPSSLSVRFIRWKERVSGEKLHNRFVLTEVGGLRIGIGLDEGEEGQTDEIEILEDAVRLVRLAEYSVPSAAFDYVDDLVVTGIKII